MSIWRRSVGIAVMCLFVACGQHEQSPRSIADNDSLYSGKDFNDHIRSTAARMPEEERLGFRLPEGFEIQLYASEPDIGKPINFNFDAKGRMWVTQSYEYPFAAGSGKGRDRLTILEDTNHDGRADVFTTVADTLNIPIGIVPMSDGAIVYSIPNVTRYISPSSNDTNYTSRKLLGPFEYKDTHGMVNNMTIGFDGWIHTCHGYTNRSTVSGTDKDSIHLVSGSTFRFSPDGRTAERETAGRINPFGLTYDEWGYLYSTDCHTSPLYQLIRGGEYPQSGKDEGIGYAPDMKPFDNEATALAGLAYYSDTLFPRDYRKNLFIGDAVTSRVYRNSFRFEGSSPVGKKEADFIKSRDPWFRPVAVQMGPDGALYVADFYNSIIGHYEVPLNHPKRDKIRGRIWRITYNSKAHTINDLTKASITELIDLFAAGNLPARLSAANQLVERGAAQGWNPLAKAMLTADGSSQLKVHGLWVAQRWGKYSDSLFMALMHETDAIVRVHALRALYEEKSPYQTVLNVVHAALADPDVHVRRAAVEMMGRFPSSETVRRLTVMLDQCPKEDTHLRYTIRLTIAKVLENSPVLQQVVKESWTATAAAWLSGIMVGVHAPEAGLFVLNYLQQHQVDVKQFGKQLKFAVRWVPAGKLPQAIALGEHEAAKTPGTAFIFYTSLQQGLEERGQAEDAAFRNWGKRLATQIFEQYQQAAEGKRRDQNALYFAMTTAGKYKLLNTRPFLQKAFSDTAISMDGRLLALRTIFTLSPDMIAPMAGQLLNDKNSTTEFKRLTLTVLADFPTKAVSDVVASISQPPADVQWWIVIVLASSDYGQHLLLQKAKTGEVRGELLTEPMIAERLSLRQSKQNREAFAKITSNVIGGRKEKQQAINQRISAYMALKPPPAATSGQPVFEKNCSPCHSIGGKGGQIGPQLDGVGKWGATSLAEKILDPNRNVSENFISYTLTLKNGRVVSGLFRREEGAVEVYVNLMGKEFSISKSDISEKVRARYTLMPDQFLNTIQPQDFNRLISYLLSQKSE